jgi:hypothetical protein
MTRTLLVIICVLAAVIGIIAGYLASQILAAEHNHHGSAISLHGTAYFYLNITVLDKTGKIKYSILKRDPPTLWFALLLLHRMLDCCPHYAEFVPNRTIIDMNATKHVLEFGKCYFMPMTDCVFVIGNGTTPPDIYDVWVESEIARFRPDEIVSGENTTHMWVYVTGYYAVRKPMSVSEVGYGCYVGGPINNWVLLMRDVLALSLKQH